jgi:signal transduction histidine kinase
MSSALFAITRRRLVFWNIAVTGIIIAAFALVAYFIAYRVLSGEIDTQLATRASQARRHFSQEGPFDADDDHDYNTDAPGVFLLLLSPDGTVQYNPLNVQLSGLPDIHALHATLESDQPDLRTVHVGAGGEVEVRLRTEGVKRNGELVGVLQLGLSTQPYDHELHALLLVLALVGFSGLALALVGGFFLASRALVPVRAAFQRQRDFVADASHELRTPLMLIRADVDVLGRELRAQRAKLPASKTGAFTEVGPSKAGRQATASRVKASFMPAASQLDDQLDLVDDALSEIDQMTHLLSDLFLLARLDSGVVSPPRQLVALDEQLEVLLEQVHRSSRARNLTLQTVLTPGVCVLGNPDQLRRLWLILLDNAIKYNRPAGSITVTCAIEDRQASVSVSDTGIGIAPADLPRLFERFYRADKAHAHTLLPPGETLAPSDLAGSGAGLGLAIAHEIVQVHGGQISVKSMPGEGSTFTVRLHIAGLEKKTATARAPQVTDRS